MSFSRRTHYRYKDFPLGALKTTHDEVVSDHLPPFEETLKQHFSYADGSYATTYPSPKDLQVIDSIRAPLRKIEFWGHAEAGIEMVSMEVVDDGIIDLQISAPTPNRRDEIEEVFIKHLELSPISKHERFQMIYGSRTNPTKSTLLESSTTPSVHAESCSKETTPQRACHIEKLSTPDKWTMQDLWSHLPLGKTLAIIVSIFGAGIWVGTFLCRIAH